MEGPASGISEGFAPRGFLIALAALTLLIFAGLPTCAGAQPFRIGFSAGPELNSSDAATRELWAGRAAAAGASVERINVSWAQVAPASRPPQFEAKNPAAPAYDWTAVDAAVRSAAAHGLQVMFTVLAAPAWAEGSGRPEGVLAGAWKPQAKPYGEFAQALASRYSGSFPDPLAPNLDLPRVRYYEAWNEPDLAGYLSPQWEGSSLASATIYRKLLNQFYAGVKRVQPQAKVIGGSLAPWGGFPGTTHPITFLRALLCLRGGRLELLRCPEPAHFDILSAHPIGIGAPTRSALSPLDVSPPDLGRVTEVLRKAEATHRALPGGRKPLWVTEFWYDSSPPDPDGVPVLQQARWYEQELYLFWKQGAQVAIGLQVADAPPGQGYEYTSQAGVYFLNGKPKPSLTAIRFPFVVTRRSADSLGLWGIAPKRGRLKVQARRGGKWTTVGAKSVGARAVFSFSVPLTGEPTELRGVIGHEASLPWALG